MKTLKCLILASVCAISSSALAELRTDVLELSFNESDFVITTEESGLTYISSISKIASYTDDVSQPALPYFSSSVTLPVGSVYKRFDVTCSKQLIKTDVVLAPNSMSVAISSIPAVNATPIKNTPDYTRSSYPETNFSYVGASNTDEASLLHFYYTPFVYDAVNKNLYFIHDIKATIYWEKNVDADTHTDSAGTAPRKTFGWTRPPIRFDTTAQKIDSMGLSGPIQAVAINRYDYLIITNRELKASFEPLAEWKELKGVSSKVVTVESIYKDNSTDDKPLQIKKYIQNEHKFNLIKYVLLGGDDEVVPVRYTYCAGSDRSSNQIPADLYYGCLSESSFDWNKDKDDKYGEFSDSINLVPTVYVTRAPVRTPEDATAFVNKVLTYEKTPTYSNTILTGGTVLWGYTPNIIYEDEPVGPQHHSDAETKSTNLYNNFIKPYWSGERHLLFDTNTSFAGGRDYQMNAKHLSERLSSGYSFVSILTHGYSTSWSLHEPIFYNPQMHEMIKGESSSYNNSTAMAQSNPVSTIVTTIACHTNAFDTYRHSSWSGYNTDPCLSECLIRNPNSGVVAYFGSSRESWGNGFDRHALGNSLQYEALFYQYLFSDELTDKNFGRIAAAAKRAKVSEAMINPYDSVKHKYTDVNTYRWLQYSLNPIGDPEMPIFTETPKKFDSLTVTVRNDTVEVSTGVAGSKVCIKGLSRLYYRVGYSSGTVKFKGVPEQFSVCVTKQNYIPKIYTIAMQPNGKMKMQEVESLEQLTEKNIGLDALMQADSKIAGCTLNRAAGTLAVSTQIDGNYDSASILITNLTGNREKNVRIPDGETDVTTNISALPAGVHVVSLVVDGNIVDSKRIIK